METTRIEAHAPAPRDLRGFLLLCLGATGVVYGDIGTSPLYTWSEIRRTGALDTAEDVLGAASLLVWTLTLAITVKYVGLVLRADNHGEGGTFALMGLLVGVQARGRAVLAALLTFAACLLYADGLITPAISVLGAAEGITVFRPGLAHWVVPFSLVVLTLLFAAQSAGTSRIGTVFGVVTVIWFLVIGGIGFTHVWAQPRVLAALLPHHAVHFLLTHPFTEVLHVLGAVVLAITGGEALYADIGHFGVRAIRWTWNVFVWPALCLSYLGQGALLLSGAPIRQGNVFYSTVSEHMLVPLILLSTCAAIIASQALISGAFSLSRSAMVLGLLPRMQILHTSEAVEGQIFIPAVNRALWFGCCALVLIFGSSSRLAGAYGLAVMGVVVATTLSIGFLAHHRWGWPWAKVGLVIGPLLVMDLMFLGANLMKLAEGAALPLAIGCALFGGMYIWRTGRGQLAAAYRDLPRIPLAELLVRRPRLAELPRAMVFLVSDPVRTPADPVPVLLLKFVDRYGALPKHTTLFTVVAHGDQPYWGGERYEVTPLGTGVTAVRMHLGYMEQPDIRSALLELREAGRITVHPTRRTILIGREEILPSPGGTWVWRARTWLFRTFVALSSQAHQWFGLRDESGLSKEIIPVVARPRRMELVLTWGFSTRPPLP